MAELHQIKKPPTNKQKAPNTNPKPNNNNKTLHMIDFLCTVCLTQKFINNHYEYLAATCLHLTEIHFFWQLKLIKNINSNGKSLFSDIVLFLFYTNITFIASVQTRLQFKLHDNQDYMKKKS